MSAVRAGRPWATQAGTAALRGVRVLLAPSAFGIGVRGHTRRLSLEVNSLGLIAAKLTTMGAGFLFWLAAAHLFARAEVGNAAGVVAALMLCTQVAILGIGSSVIAEYGRHEDSPQHLVNSALTLVAGTAIVASGVFVALAATVITKLHAASSPLYAVVFLVAAVLAAILLLLDQLAAALRRGDQAFARALVFGGGTLLCLGAVTAAGADGSLAIFAPWAVAGTLAAALGALQLRRTIAGYRPRPVADRPALGGLLRLGIPNHILTLSERVPGLLMPIFVAQIVSPEANAAWYAAWMMAWLAYMIPIQTGFATFAEIASEPERLDDVVGRGLRSALRLGVVAALGLIVLATPLLSLLGSSYAADGAMPLRVLALAIIPVTFTYAYFAACRGLRVPQRAIPLGWGGVALVVVATIPALELGGLTAMAVGFVAAQSVVGALAAWRLRRLRKLDGASLVATATPLRRGPSHDAY